MLERAFEKFLDGVVNLPKTLSFDKWEIKVNELLKEFQVNAGIKEPDIAIANLFIALINGTTPITDSPALPNGLNLTYLSRGPSGIIFPRYISQTEILKSKIVDQETRELFLIPLLVQNFSAHFKINDQMLDLLNGLSCADGSKPKLDADSLNKTSAEFVEYLRRFQSADLPPNAAPMSLRQMYGILQSFERFKSFGFALKQPKAIGACRQGDFGSSPSQFLRFGLYPELEYKFYGDFQNGNIRFSREGIKQIYTIFHEMLHMFFPGNQFYYAGLQHIDDLKFLNPFLQLSDTIPITALNVYSRRIPDKYTQRQTIGLLDRLLIEAARKLASPYKLPPGCNSEFIGPGSVFRNFCLNNNIDPVLAMTIPYDYKSLLEALMAPPPLQPPQISSKPPTNSPAIPTPATTPPPILHQVSNLIISMIATEFFTALTKGGLQIVARNLNLSKDKKEALLSLGENAGRIGFTAYNENIKSAICIATFSGIANMAKILDLGFKRALGKSVQEITTESIIKMSNNIIGEEMTEKIGALISDTPEHLKTFTNQFLFVFFIHSLSELSKNSDSKDNKIQTPKIEERILIGLLASAFSALMGGVINHCIDKLFPRGEESPTIRRDTDRAIEISAVLGVVTAQAQAQTPAPAPASASATAPGQQSPSTLSPLQQTR